MFSAVEPFTSPHLIWDVKTGTCEIGEGLPAWRGTPGITLYTQPLANALWTRLPV